MEEREMTWEELDKRFGIIKRTLKEPIRILLAKEMLNCENWELLKNMLGIPKDIEYFYAKVVDIEIRENKNKGD